MTQVNLLPSDVRNRQRARRVTMAAAGGVCAVVVMLLAVFVLQSARLDQANRQLSAEQLVNGGLRSKIAGLTKFELLRQSVTTRQAIVDGLLHEQVLWSDALTDLSSAMPDNVWLTTMNGTVNTDGQSDLVGSIALEGDALGFRDVASFLSRLEQVRGWVNSWTSSVSRTQIEGRDAVQFTASLDLSQAATIDGRPK